MEIRRVVQLTGGSSYTITLPKEWAQQIGIKKGSVLIIKNSSDGGIILYPETATLRREQEVEITLNPHVGRYIVGAYLYGYNIIKIKSTIPMDDSELSEIKRVVRGLAGAEIVDETPNKMEIQVVLDEELVAPEKILRRQYNLVIGMVENSVEALFNRNPVLGRLVIQRDEEVDRLYFTLVRVVRSAVVDLALAKKLNTSPLSLMDLRMAAKFIEDAGDQAAEIGSEAIKNSKGLDNDVLNEARELAQIVLSMGEGPLDALFSKDMDKIVKIINIRSEFLKKGEAFLRKIPYTKNTAVFFKVYSHLAKICEDFSDIAELGLPLKTR